jgi:hypothetical protein
MKVKKGALVITKLGNEERFIHVLAIVKEKTKDPSLKPWGIRLDESLAGGASRLPLFGDESNMFPLILLPKKDRRLSPCAAFQTYLPQIVEEIAPRIKELKEFLKAKPKIVS